MLAIAVAQIYGLYFFNFNMINRYERNASEIELQMLSVSYQKH